MSTSNPTLPIAGRRVPLPGHFHVAVLLEAGRPLDANGSGGYACRAYAYDRHFAGPVRQVGSAPDGAWAR